jgi:hypothetical protein
MRGIFNLDRDVVESQSWSTFLLNSGTSDQGTQSSYYSILRSSVGSEAAYKQWQSRAQSWRADTNLR